jgi:hypothetical protein
MTTFTRGHLATRSARNGTPTHQVNRAIGEAEDHTQVYATTLAGDPTTLRGIPAIGRNVTGAIPGTSPHKIR